MIAGPNGAGKTTFYESFLASLPLPFVNADQIARTLARDDPASIAYGAAEVADRERRELLALRRSFIMETVFSDPAGDKLAFLRAAQTAGYAVILLFVGIVSPELSILRVAQRALEGGHDVPPDKLQQRFPRTQRNLAAALAFVDVALIFDNEVPSTAVPSRRHLAQRQRSMATPTPPHGVQAARDSPPSPGVDLTKDQSLGGKDMPVNRSDKIEIVAVGNDLRFVLPKEIIDRHQLRDGDEWACPGTTAASTDDRAVRFSIGRRI